MKNNVEFAFYIEKESAISLLNRFMLKEFRHKTQLWSDEASHNILIWLLSGSARYFDEKSGRSIEMDKKVISIKRESPFVIDAEPGALLLTYSFDDYLPFDTETLKQAENKNITETECFNYTDVPSNVYHELESVTSCLSTLSKNEALTFISLQKVIHSMMLSCGKTKITNLFAPLLSRKNEETAKYARLINFSEKNSKKVHLLTI